jgi:hypothetical protein
LTPPYRAGQTRISKRSEMLMAVKQRSTSQERMIDSRVSGNAKQSDVALARNGEKLAESWRVTLKIQTPEMIQRLLASVFQLLLRIRTGTASSETLPRRNVAKAPSGRSLHSAPGRGVRSPGVNVPNHFVPRQEALQALKEGLLNGLSNPVALTGGGKIGV